ncbi:DUF6702 family protein [Mesonia aquimarina]|uniref:DUF6702 family protein n=1 Tax=Mesonia aquimarina TaxID=1504967 RepID=UPI000EF5A54C|nr:DUF6702 family protein [Mesonia aquimarina]
MMKSKKILILFLLIPLLAFPTAHKFYLSVTEVNYAAKENTLQITSRLFVDDFQKLLQKRYDENIQLIRGENKDKVNAYITKYFREKLQLRIKDKTLKMNFIGKRYEDDLIICYFEVTNVKNFKTISVSNSLLLDLFEEQKNLVHFSKNGDVKSKMLHKDKIEGRISF